MTIKTCLMDDPSATIEIGGKTFSCEEAGMMWHEMTTRQRSEYLGMTDAQIVESIYREYFPNYFA